jgi:hypothetical protein
MQIDAAAGADTWLRQSLAAELVGRRRLFQTARLKANRLIFWWPRDVRPPEMPKRSNKIEPINWPATTKTITAVVPNFGSKQIAMAI